MNFSHLAFMLSVEMGRSVIVEKELDNYAVEAADFRHPVVFGDARRTLLALRVP